MEAEKSILEQDGVHFINKNLLEPDNRADIVMDNDFRTLVESVIGNKPKGLFNIILSMRGD